jgi:hypothetical protein
MLGLSSKPGTGSTPGAKKGIDWATIAEYAGAAIAVTVLMMCCCGVAIYIGFSYLTGAPKKQAAGPRKVKSSRPRAGSSRRKDDLNDDGVSMSNLLSASDIEDRLTQVRGSSKTYSSSSSDEEPVAKSGKKTHAVSSHNSMNY